ncbi:MAG: HI0074 family nucleotidyltransferase substrate-binding subunit, partial [Cetobacterium sp.]
MYGLSDSDFYSIIEILKSHTPDIKWVKIFGSRAREDFKKNSDIDLAVALKKDVLLDLKEKFYSSTLGYTIDVIDYEKNTNQKLKDYIDKEGKIIFKTDEKGNTIMNENKLKDKLEDFNKALSRLENSLLKDPHIDDLYLDGTIQRFEFVYELSWKLMKNFLEFNGIEVSSPRESFRESFKADLISDASEWIKMMENRNRTSHTYNEDTAWDIYKKIKTDYIILFKNFSNIITK